MKMFVLVIVLVLGVLGNTFAQEKKVITLGIVNGKASYLPKPDYPQEAKDFCASGKVEVEILIGEDGKVIKAKAISGDELLYDSAVEAASKARFVNTPDITSVKVRGIIVYNFIPEQKCISSGRIVNEKALSIPKPRIADFNKTKRLRIEQEELVEVQIIIESQSGEVIRARAISGRQAFRAACENSARQTKFSPINDVPLVLIRANLIYKFKPNGKIEF